MKSQKIRLNQILTAIQAVFDVEIGLTERPGIVNNDHYIFLRNTQL